MLMLPNTPASARPPPRPAEPNSEACRAPCLARPQGRGPDAARLDRPRTVRRVEARALPGFRAQADRPSTAEPVGGGGVTEGERLLVERAHAIAREARQRDVPLHRAGREGVDSVDRLRAVDARLTQSAVVEHRDDAARAP